MFFDKIEQLRGDIYFCSRVQFADTGRTGDIHFCQIITNDIKTHKIQSFRAHYRADYLANPFVIFCQWLHNTGSTCR